MTAILGKRDSPTDAVEDYCRLLGAAFEQKGIALRLTRVSWDETGWAHAVWCLWNEASGWAGRWAVVQYTAMMWSRRGISLMFLVILITLKIRRVRIGVVFHDTGPCLGSRLRDLARRTCQLIVMKCAYALSDVSIITAGRESWLQPVRKNGKAAFIPVGSNFPTNLHSISEPQMENKPRRVILFSFSSATYRQVLDTLFAVGFAASNLGALHLILLGRTMEGVEAKMRDGLRSSSVIVQSLGLLPPEEVSRVLLGSDVLLFSRGCLTANRGSCMAAIGCGVPIVAYGNPDPSSPLSKSGIVFVPYGDREGLSRALLGVLSDRNLWEQLHIRNLQAFERFFSWQSIAAQYLDTLRTDYPSQNRANENPYL